MKYSEFKREDEKRYRLRLPWTGFYIELNNRDGVNQTTFTESEIEELKEKLKAKYNLDSFILEEVKEDE